MAGGEITAWQNGWALAGDFLSAAALLGIAGIVTSNGFDGMVYSIGWLVGWPIILFLIVEPLRNVGKFTFADVVAYRLSQKPVRPAAAIGTLAVISSHRADGCDRGAHQAAIRHPVFLVSHHRRDRHADLRALWRYARCDLASGRQSGS